MRRLSARYALQGQFANSSFALKYIPFNVLTNKTVAISLKQSPCEPFFMNDFVDARINEINLDNLSVGIVDVPSSHEEPQLIWDTIAPNQFKKLLPKRQRRDRIIRRNELDSKFWEELSTSADLHLQDMEMRQTRIQTLRLQTVQKKIRLYSDTSGISAASSKLLSSPSESLTSFSISPNLPSSFSFSLDASTRPSNSSQIDSDTAKDLLEKLKVLKAQRNASSTNLESSQKKKQDDDLEDIKRKALQLDWSVKGVAKLIGLPLGKVLEVAQNLLESGDATKETTPVTLDEAEFIVEELKLNRYQLNDFHLAIEVARKARGIKWDLRPRPPIVTIMGHVNHGKTSLLDALRSSNLADQEYGGITQKISMFSVITPKTHSKITFIDTPGHNVFTGMRARGAQVTDIVVLVVAATEGVMPQTIEAINHAKAAQVPVIVAINKMDKEDADPSRVMNELSEYGVVAEVLGGDVQVVPVSALEKTGLDDLEEEIIALAELLELKSSFSSTNARATVLEASLDVSRSGTSLFSVVKHGTFKPNDHLVCNGQATKIKALIDPSTHEDVSEATPGMPIIIIVPNTSSSSSGSFVLKPGDQIMTMPSAREARRTAERFSRMEQAIKMDSTSLWKQSEAEIFKSLKGRRIQNVKLKAILEEFENKEKIQQGKSSAQAISEKYSSSASISDLQRTESSDGQDEEASASLDESDFTRAFGEVKQDDMLMPMPLPAARVRQVAVMLKAAQQGELEPLQDFMNEFVAALPPTSDGIPPIVILGSSVGDLTSKEAERIGQSRGIIIGFNLNVSQMNDVMMTLADGSSIGLERYLHDKGVGIRSHKIIFDCFEDIKALYYHHFGPASDLRTKGGAVVDQVGWFTLSKAKGGKNRVCGVKVTNGDINSSLYYRIVRDGKILNPRRVLKVKSMQKADNEKSKTSRLSTTERGAIIFKGWSDIMEGDQIVALEAAKRDGLWGYKDFFKNIEV